MKHSIQFHPKLRRKVQRRSGFTLVEILVAVSIMSLLLAIILVPLRLGFETYHIGTARSGLQQEMQLTMQQISKDFKRANFVFPNSRISGISDNTANLASDCALAPYPSNGTNGNTDWKRLPYIRSDVAPGATSDPALSGIGITSNSVKAISNPSRIDMLLLGRNNGRASQVGEDYVVTYYPRRLDISKRYDVIDNPIVLFRAQYPYRRLEGMVPNTSFKDQPAKDSPSSPSPPTSINVETDWTKLPAALVSGSNDAIINRNFLWITHNFFGEANLQPLCIDASETPSTTGNQVAEDVIGSHTLITPRGMQLVAPSAPAGGAGSYIPELSFVESTSDGKRIDRITVNMTLAQYDQIGAAAVNGQGKAQRVPVSQTFDLPNAGCPN